MGDKRDCKWKIACSKFSFTVRENLIRPGASVFVRVSKVCRPVVRYFVGMLSKTNRYCCIFKTNVIILIYQIIKKNLSKLKREH